MTTQFRINAIRLNTSGGEVSYGFTSDLTVLAGPTGVGKTTLLEMVKYGLGGAGKLAPIVRNHVNEISLEIRIGNASLGLSRSIGRAKGTVVRVDDLLTRERLPDHHVGKGRPSISSLLLSALGLSDDMRAAARVTRSTNPGPRITFNDIFSFMYISQYDMNRDIAGSQDDYREPKRKAVFELLFGITNPRILTLRSEMNRMNGDIEIADRERDIVLTFLHDSNTTSRDEAGFAKLAAQQAKRAAHATLDELHDGIDPVEDRESRALRDLLAEAERSLADARATVIEFIRRQAEYGAERRRIHDDLGRLQRMQDAGRRLAGIEFMVCPRCMQPLNHLERQVPEDNCVVCLQPDTAAVVEDNYEMGQLTDLLTEVDYQIEAIIAQLQEASHAVIEREELVKSISAKLDSRTAERVTPRLQAYRDASEAVAAAGAHEEHLERTLRQWDRADDLSLAADTLRQTRERLRVQITDAEANLNDRRDEILSEINQEFRQAVANLGIPSIGRAGIDPVKYLPLLDDQPFETVSLAGGIITATQIAYWTSLLRVALTRGDTYYPAFLLIDHPRLALNTSEELAAGLYRSLVTLADVADGLYAKPLQFIIADNELPDSYRRHYAQVDFTYDHPTVYTIAHPGPGRVQPLTDM
jgi:AAA domain